MYGADSEDAIVLRDDLLISVLKEYKKKEKLSAELIRRIKKQVDKDAVRFNLVINWES